jgi:hypothetical protein
VALYVAKYHDAQYLHVFLALSTADAVFMSLVLSELSMSVLRPIRSSLPGWTFMAIACVLALLFASIWPFTEPAGLTRLSPTSRYIVRLDLCVSGLRILFFIAMAACSQLLTIGWRDRELQTATGLAFYSFASLSVTLLHMNQGVTSEGLISQYHLLDELAACSYILSMLYWIMSFAQKVPERRKFTPQMEKFLLEVVGAARAGRAALTDF